MYCQEYIYIFYFYDAVGKFIAFEKNESWYDELGNEKKRWWMEFDKDIF